ncbi:cytochrome b-c1 complex subunit 8-2, mitochondrial [Daucus carota subsp. sativus]|uniref:cytochrome b-c1 complex subunit 8-2, mitochondrial n=1 Tax=Daucus carota subsp. sativus TaxID=79200 RepID=UPI0007EFBBA6|nr:PREDICTED: cytochrome b-c1 complex subunit 8-like [Daucus carota subsp. sativus]
MGVGGGSSAKVKSVVYALSPYQQQTMPGLWKDFTSKIYKRTLGDWVSISLVAVPVIGTYLYANDYKEKEKLSHRY